MRPPARAALAVAPLGLAAVGGLTLAGPQAEAATVRTGVPAAAPALAPAEPSGTTVPTEPPATTAPAPTTAGPVRTTAGDEPTATAPGTHRATSSSTSTTTGTRTYATGTSRATSTYGYYSYAPAPTYGYQGSGSGTGSGGYTGSGTGSTAGLLALPSPASGGPAPSVVRTLVVSGTPTVVYTTVTKQAVGSRTALRGVTVTQAIGLALLAGVVLAVVGLGGVLATRGRS